jgi:hypothetical protein
MDSQRRVVVKWRMPETPRRIFDLIQESAPLVELALLEQVGGFIGRPQPGSHMFKFGRMFGLLEMALAAADVPYQLVASTKWLKGVEAPEKKPEWSYNEWKRKLKEHAERLFPKEETTLATADALLISEYCRRKMTGILKDSVRTSSS